MVTEKKKEVSITDGTGEDDYAHDRDTWGNQCEFFLSCLGYAVGFGNIWRFPFLCFKNGGAAFLIPYVIMLLVAGLPMFFLELAIGQYVSLGPNILFPELSPIFSGVGWAMLATTAMTSVYYNMVFAWSLFYTFASFTPELPWGSCDNDFNSFNCFTYDQSIACRNESKYYYNKTCLDIAEFCQISPKMEKYNETHCAINIATETLNITEAQKAVVRISSSEDYYKNRMLQVEGTSWNDMGSMRWELVGCLALAWTIVCFCMIKGVKSSGKVVYVTAIFPYIVLLILFIRGITLKGAYKGIEFYIMKPNITKLGEVQVWQDAATQIFYSLSTAFGGLITLSSYNKFRNNCMRDAIVISIANCSTSIFAGFVIFSILGFMAAEIGVEVRDVADSGSGLAFIAYPAAVARMPIPPLWSILFFLMLITLGIDSQFTFVETLSTGLFDRYKSLRNRKPLVMICLSTFLFLLGLSCCLEGGIYMFELLNYYSAGLSVLFIAIAEIIAVVYVYGLQNILNRVTSEMGVHIPRPLRIYWTVTLKFLTPASLFVILVLSIINFQPGRWGSYIYPDNIQTLGWFTTFASMICIPLFAIYVLVKGYRDGKSFKELLSATEKFIPAHRRKHLKEKEPMDGVFKYFPDNADTNAGVKYIQDNPGFVGDSDVRTVPPSKNGSVPFSNHI